MQHFAGPALAIPSNDNPPLVESLLQALNTLVDRLNQAEARMQSGGDHSNRDGSDSKQTHDVATRDVKKG